MRKPSRDLTEGSVVRNIWFLALPMMASSVLQNTFNIVDMIFVGRLGPSAIAAVTVSGVILGFLFVLIFGIYMGTVAMVARFVGAGRESEAENVAVQSLFLGFFCYAAIAIIGYPSAPYILKMMGASEDVILQGLPYIRIMFLGSIAMIVGVVLSSVLRAAGDAITPLIIMAISTVINIGLDPCLIFGLWRFPQLGVAGSALATVIARAVGVLILLRIFLSGSAIVHLRIKNARIDFSTMRRVIRIGIFASLQGILRNMSGLVLMPIVAKYSTLAVAAYGISMRLQMIVMMPGFGLGTAVSTLVGQNLGAGKPKRAERTAWITVGFGAAIMASFGIIYIIFSRSIFGVFSKSPEVTEIGIVCLRIMASAYGFIALGVILGRALSGAGDTLSPMVMTAIGLLGFRVGLSLLFSWKLGLIGIWIGIASSSIIQGLMTGFWFNTGRWKSKQV
jgi:putative MATE family efflux protein